MSIGERSISVTTVMRLLCQNFKVSADEAKYLIHPYIKEDAVPVLDYIQVCRELRNARMFAIPPRDLEREASRRLAMNTCITEALDLCEELKDHRNAGDELTKIYEMLEKVWDLYKDFQDKNK